MKDDRYNLDYARDSMALVTASLMGDDFTAALERMLDDAQSERSWAVIAASTLTGLVTQMLVETCKGDRERALEAWRKHLAANGIDSQADWARRARDEFEG